MQLCYGHVYLILTCIRIDYSLEPKDLIKRGTVFFGKQVNRLYGEERIEGELHQFV